MTAYTWSAASAGNASSASNWTPSGVPTTGDDCTFDNTSVENCNWDVAAVDTIAINSDYTGEIDFANDVTLEGLSIGAEGCFAQSSAKVVNFTGTPTYKSNSCYIIFTTTNDPYSSDSSRANLTFAVQASVRIFYDYGKYPRLRLDSGSHTADYVSPTVSDESEVRLLSLEIASGVTFAPASGVPSANDRTIKWTIQEGVQTQFVVDADSFDGGYATWTFQASSSGFILPTDGCTSYGGNTGCDFTFRKMILTGNAGDWAQVQGANTLILNDLTINTGVALKGDDSLGSAIHLVNRPTIKGTWGFHPIADGIYHYKSNTTTGVADGGTGLRRITPGQIPFGSTAQKMATDSKLTWDTAGSELTVNGKLTVSGLIDPTGMEFTAVGTNPGTDAAKTIWVNANDSNKLYFGGSEVGGGGGGSGTVTSVAVSGSDGIEVDSGSPITTSGTIALGVDAAALRTHINVEDGADVTNATNVTAAGALMDSEVTNLAQVKAFDSADYATAAQGALADSALQDPAQFATAAQGILADSAIQPGKYEAGSTPISAKGFIDTGSDTSWISQTEGSRAVPTANATGSSQIFSNGVESLVTAWNQDLVTTQGITYSSGVWTIDTAGIYEIRAQFGFLDGDAASDNGLGNPSSSDFIQALAYILHSSDGADPQVGPSPTPEDFLVRGPIFLYTNGTGLSAKGPHVSTVRRLDVGDRIAFAVFARKQSNTSSSLKFRLRSGFYNECSIRRVG